jgi:hypothetical protein
LVYFFSLLIFTLTFFPQGLFAATQLNARADYFASSKLSLPRGLLKVTQTNTLRNFNFFCEAFAEADFSTENQRLQRRTEQASAALQELWLEYRFKDVFVKFGRQAQRWSESWTLPSLDVFTGRRLNRLFFDPLSESLVHSTGLSVSWANHLDVFAVGQNAMTILPEPAPKYLDSQNEFQPGIGARAQFDFWGFNTKWIAAQIQKDTTTGFLVNYATDFWVPRLEVGSRKVDASNAVSTNSSARSNLSFTTVGLDFFYENLSLFSQFTRYDDISQSYLSLQYNPGRWSLQFQGVRAFTSATTQTDDLYANVQLSYNLNSAATVTGFVQNYEGRPGGLYNIYREQTQGAVGGARLDWNIAFN